MSVLDTLITDRSLKDVFNETQKGHYGASDMNRVEQAMQYIKSMFTKYGYSVNISGLHNWTNGNIPNESQFNRYLADVSELRGKLTLPEGTPEIPESMRNLKFSGANDIEKMLQVLGYILESIEKTYALCGVSECGGDYI